MEQDNGFIGDIKYSIIEPGAFEKAHPDWKLLKGQTIEIDSGLGKLGITQLPDARGMFLRGMNWSRNDEFADADGDNRNILTPQKDSIRTHSHSIQNIYSIANAGTPWSNADDHNNVGSHYGTQIQTSETGIAETRPGNIALYIYIKIN